MTNVRTPIRGQIIDMHGNVINADVVPPGGRLRVPLRLMDGNSGCDLELLRKVRHALSAERGEERNAADDAERAADDDDVVELQPHVRRAFGLNDDDDDDDDEARVAYDQRSRRMSNAW